MWGNNLAKQSLSNTLESVIRFDIGKKARGIIWWQTSFFKYWSDPGMLERFGKNTGCEG